jgi:uncharacterized protein
MPSVNVLPVGSRCNLRCEYCYESRDLDQRPVDLDAMKASLRGLDRFTLFGGEPLLADRGILEELFQLGIELHGQNGIQTNALAITEEHAVLFKRYRVHVGISFDGPGVLSAPRCTVVQAEKIDGTIRGMLRDGFSLGLIVTLTRANTGENGRQRLVEWFRELDALGLRSARLHLLQPTVQGADLMPSSDDLVWTLQAIQRASLRFSNLRFDLFSDALALQRGCDERVTCVFRGCDPLSTPEISVVLADGTVWGCPRILHGPKADRPTFSRQLVLRETPQEEGGCQGCRFFILCKGQCPATALDGDVRKRSVHCDVWKAVLTWAENALTEVYTSPVSRRPDLPELEDMMMDDWKHGRYPRVQYVVERLQRRRSRKGRPSLYDHTDVA